MSSLKFILTFLLILNSTFLAIAHGDLHERILFLSNQIDLYPDSLFLYYKRGQVYNQHLEFSKALNDFKHCKKNGYDNLLVDMEIAQSYNGSKKYKKAKKTINKLLEKDPGHVRALALKARIYSSEEKFEEAATLFEDIISLVDKPRTDNYIEAANAWLNIANRKEGEVKALRVTDKGIERLGEIIVLLKFKVNILMNSENYEEAIATQSRIIELSNRKERGYYSRALIHVKMNDMDSAISDLSEAQAHLNSLPLRLKSVKANQELKQSMNS